VVDLGLDSLVVDSKDLLEVGLPPGIVVASEEKSGWPVGSPRMAAVARVGLAKAVPAVRPVAGIPGSCNRVPDLPFRIKKKR
jgi:hypothetical protein